MAKNISFGIAEVAMTIIAVGTVIFLVLMGRDICCVSHVGY